MSRARNVQAIMSILAGIGDTQRPTEFRRLFRLQIMQGILAALRLRLINAAIADEAWRAVTEGAD